MDDLALVDVVDDDGSSAEECAIAAEMALVRRGLAALLQRSRAASAVPRPPAGAKIGVTSGASRPDAAGGADAAATRRARGARRAPLAPRRATTDSRSGGRRCHRRMWRTGPASMANLGRRMSLSSEAKLQGERLRG